VFTQQNQTVWIFERERAKQDAFDERENRGGSADPESEGQNDGESKPGILAEAAKCEPEIVCETVHEILLLCGWTADEVKRLETIAAFCSTDDDQGFLKMDLR
jgi:hypothetical protein